MAQICFDCETGEVKPCQPCPPCPPCPPGSDILNRLSPFQVTHSFWTFSITRAFFNSFQVPGDPSPGFHSGLNIIYPDVSYQVVTSNSDPEVDVFEPGSWTNRPSGTRLLTRFRVPRDFILPDATETDTPNNPTIIANTDTGAILYLNAATRPVPGGPLWGWIGTPDTTHGGSGTVGGEITGREFEIGLINHALALQVWAQKYLSQAYGGFLWPAIRADEGFNNPDSGNFYGGTNPLLRMGTLVGIPPGVTPESLGVTSRDGLTVFKALQQFGAYIIDNTAWDAFSICATPEAVPAFNAIRPELLRMMAALQIVTQSFQGRVGVAHIEHEMPLDRLVKKNRQGQIELESFDLNA